MSEYRMEELIYLTKEDGETVINGLNKYIETYGSVSVYDLYELSGIQGNIKDHKYGWNDVSSARLVGDEYGHALKIENPRKFK